MHGPSKLVALLGLIAVAIAADGSPAAVAAHGPPAAIAVRGLTDTGKVSAETCNVSYEVYEGPNCVGTSTGLCGQFECRDLRGMGSQSITVGNNVFSSITVVGYSQYGCVGEMQRITISQGTKVCLQYNNEFYSIQLSQ